MRPALVLLHSSGASARQWDVLARSLSDAFDVHALELHGHGARAPWPGRAPLTLADEAALVDTLIERRGSVHLVGHSYGGAVALDVACRRPDAVRSLAVYEPVLFRALFADGASAAQARAVRQVAGIVQELVAQGREAAAAERFVDFWSGSEAWARMPAARQTSIAARMRSVARHFDAAFAAADPRAPLAGQRLPRLVLTGADTVPATWRIGQLLRAAWPQAEHVALPGLDHMGPLTHAAAVNHCITDFLLRQVEPARRPAAPSLLQPATA
jgi:pimeloyl-ACP methyl ester carboxylesterase